jgi:hypothetical protein
MAARSIRVLYVYGAADRSGLGQVGPIRQGLTRAGFTVEDDELFVIDWGRFATNPREADRLALLDDRFGSSAAEARQLLRSVLRAKLLRHAIVRLLFGWYVDRVDLLGPYRGVSAASYPVLLDVFAYLRNTERIIAPVIERIDYLVRSSQRPVVAIGLSLGGIILVDALSRWGRTAGDPARRQLKLLTTVGSQSPMLYACDALLELRRDGPAATSPFVPWLNVWRRLDVLSFPAEPLFGTQVPDRSDIRDVVLDPGPDYELFPDAHTSYFDDDRVYGAIAAMLSDLGTSYEAPSGGAGDGLAAGRVEVAAAAAPFDLESVPGALIARI